MLGVIIMFMNNLVNQAVNLPLMSRSYRRDGYEIPLISSDKWGL